MKTMIVYHNHCIDGITAATVVTKHLIDRVGIMSKDITLCAMSYDDDITNLYEALKANEIEKLFIVDFSFNVPTLLDLNKHVALIELYDHHASAFRNLMGAKYPLAKTSKENFYLSDDHNDPTDIHIILDNNECGASLCHKWLVNSPDTFSDVAEETLPSLIRYVKDYDLWRFANKDTKAVNKFLKQVTKTIPTYSALLTAFDDKFFELKAIKEGTLMLAYEDKIEDELISQGVTPITINGIQGLAVNAPYNFASNIGDKLAVESKSFGAVWSQLADGKVSFSLRSTGDECDVSKLAEVMGGGGHKTAAGFTFMSPAYDPEKGITLWSGVDYASSEEKEADDKENELRAMSEQEHEITEEDGATNG